MLKDNQRAYCQLDFRTFGLAEGCHRGPAQRPANSQPEATSGTVVKGARVAHTVTMVHTRSLITGFPRLILTGGGNCLSLTGRLERGDESVGVGKAQR
jgi:hypothetical protein